MSVRHSGLALVHLDLIQLGREHFAGQCTVLVLAAFVLTGSHNTRGDVSQSDRRFGLVHLLTTGTAGSILVLANVLFPVNVDLKTVVNLRHHVHARKRRVSTTGRIERADANQSMVAGFAMQITVDVIAFDQQCGIADTGLFSRRHVHFLNFKSSTLGPASIHPHQHLSPVGGICTTFTRLHSHISIGCVLGPRHRRLQLDLVHFNRQSLGRRSQLAHVLAAGIILSKLHQHLQVITGGGQFPERCCHGFQLPQLIHDLSSPFLVPPEITVTHPIVDFLNASRFAAQVKDSPSDGRRGESTRCSGCEIPDP